MSCLVAILFFIFFPIVYLWFQLKTGFNNFNRRTDGGSRARRPDNAADSAKRPPTQKDGKKKHVFKPGEGEYVDYQEMS